MLRSYRYLMLYLLQTIGLLFGGGAVYSLLMYLMSGGVWTDFDAGRTVGIMAMLTLLIPFITFMTMYTAYQPVALSMGSTRRGYFSGMQLCKASCSALLALTMTIGLAVLAPGVLPLTAAYVALLGTLWSVCSVGELLGLLTVRFGGVVGVIVGCAIGLVSAVIGGIIGYSSVSGHSAVLASLTKVLEALSRSALLFWAGGAAAIIGILFTLCSAGFQRRVQIR